METFYEQIVININHHQKSISPFLLQTSSYRQLCPNLKTARRRRLPLRPPCLR